MCPANTTELQCLKNPYCFSFLLDYKEHKENLINMPSVSAKLNSNAKYAIKGLNIRQESNLE